jgi:hypothetical protein
MQLLKLSFSSLIFSNDRILLNNYENLQECGARKSVAEVMQPG